MDTSPALAAAREPSAADRVYTFVKEGIVGRRFAPDALLAEGQIADAVGVSRTPVREGLLRLEVEGLVRLLPKRGVLIVPVTPDEIADVLETRLLVELFAARKAIEAGSPRPLLAALQGHIDSMHAAVRAKDTSAYVTADRAFHAHLVEAAGNAILINLYASLRDRQLRMGVTNLLSTDTGAVDMARMRATVVEHEHMLAAIARGSVRASAAAVEAHLQGARRLIGRPR